MTPAAAVEAARDLADSASFLPSMRVTPYERFNDGQHVDVPITVVFMTRDLMVRHKRSRLDQLPPTTRVVTLAGCGHVPFYDDPDAVTSIIVEALAGSAPLVA